jgi:vancomycin permeability regulator SanA
MKKIITGGLVFAAVLAVIAALMLAVNAYVVFSTKKQIISEEDFDKIGGADCILVLGAGVRNGEPSPMLKDRLESAISLYNLGLSSKIIMSGDHGRKDYDEVNVMKTFATSKDVFSQDVFMDHAGFSSYDSIYRAKEVFGAKKIIIVTQKYHLYRALYIANSLDLEAYGVSSDARIYAGQKQRNVREILARNKDFFKCIFKPKPKYLGEPIDITGSGDVTNDK